MTKRCGGQECTPSSLWLSHEQPALFYSPQWQHCGKKPTVGGGSYVAYLVHRTFWALYLTAWIIVSGIRPGEVISSPDDVKWFLYLTDWAFLILTSSALLRAVCSLYAYAAYVRHGMHVRRMTWWLKVSWFAYSMSSSMALVVSALYWGVIYGGTVDSTGINTHGINSLYVLLDLCVTAMPVRILHFWIPVLLAVCYIAFSAAYDLLGGTGIGGTAYIYKVLDWSSTPATAGMYCAASLIGLIALHFLLFGLTKLRVFASGRCSAAPTESTHHLATSKVAVWLGSSDELVTAASHAELFTVDASLKKTDAGLHETDAPVPCETSGNI